MLEIKAITEADIPAWEAMQDELYGQVEAEAIMQRNFEPSENGEEAFLAFEDGMAIGFLEMSLRNIVDGCTTSPVAFIEGIFVKPEARGHGIGATLITHAQVWAISKECTELATDSVIHDKSAQDFHQAMGFEESGRIVQFRKDLTSEGK